MGRPGDPAGFANGLLDDCLDTAFFDDFSPNGFFDNFLDTSSSVCLGAASVLLLKGITIAISGSLSASLRWRRAPNRKGLALLNSV